jgi:hypothetical protein
MQNHELSKPMKRSLRKLSMEAHEEELRRGLVPLAQSFEEWRAGQVGSGELADLIHEFHNGPVRELFRRYNSGMLKFTVSSAIARGVLDRQTVPEEVLEFLAREIMYCEEDARREA